MSRVMTLGDHSSAGVDQWFCTTIRTRRGRLLLAIGIECGGAGRILGEEGKLGNVQCKVTDLTLMVWSLYGDGAPPGSEGAARRDGDGSQWEMRIYTATPAVDDLM